MTSSGGLLRFSKRGIRETTAVVVSLTVLIGCAVAWCFEHGWILYYGDAQAHLDLSRSIIDSRTPGYDQLGTVWLPLLHVICLPFVRNDSLWSTGLAGAIPVALCFVIAGTCFYLAAKDAYASSLAAGVVLSCFALNPNVLYLASVPMTEIVFSAGIALFLFALFRFRVRQNGTLIALGVLGSWSMSLTRYDGWFLIPFAALAFAIFSERRRWRVFLLFSLWTGLVPLYWLAHNWWETGNALDFYNGPYSPAAIQAASDYPGYHDWMVAAAYYLKAGQVCTGWPLAVLGILGIFCAARKTAIGPVLFLLVPPVFYVCSIHSAHTPIYVPQLEPHSYYNSRYAIPVVVLAAFGAGAIVLVLPQRWKRFAVVLPLISLAPWVLQPSKEKWVCWKESQVNSEARRAWTEAAVQFLSSRYRWGEGILIPSASGDVSGILCRARIPLRETINVGNGPAWFANTTRPDLVHQDLWAVGQSGDAVTKAIRRGEPMAYRIAAEIQLQGAPALAIYRRSDAATK